MTEPAGRPPTLHYAPLVYRHRGTNKVVGFAMFIAMAVALVGVLRWRGIATPIWLQCFFVGIPVFLMAIAFWHGLAAECRVEGDHLWFTAEEVPPTTVPVAAIVSINRCDGIENEDYHFELAVRGKGRMKVPADVFEPIKRLREALLVMNPNIQFGRRSIGDCGACGRSMAPAGYLPSHGFLMRVCLMHAGQRPLRCPLCGERLPTEYGRFV